MINKEKQNNKNINNKNINKKNINKETLNKKNKKALNNKNVNTTNVNTTNVNNEIKDKMKKKMVNKLIKGGICSYDDSCGSIMVKIEPIKPLNDILNFLINGIQLITVVPILKAYNAIGSDWNVGIRALSTILEELISLLIFSINGFTSIINFFLDDFKFILRTTIGIITSANPISLIAIISIPFYYEIISYIMDNTTIDVFTSLVLFDFKPLLKYIGAFFNLLIGKTVSKKCNLADYGYDKNLMNRECYEHYVPSCKLNLSTIYYVSLGILSLLYISGWIGFLKIFYPTD